MRLVHIIVFSAFIGLLAQGCNPLMCKVTETKDGVTVEKEQPCDSIQHKAVEFTCPQDGCKFNSFVLYQQHIQQKTVAAEAKETLLGLVPFAFGYGVNHDTMKLGSKGMEIIGGLGASVVGAIGSTGNTTTTNIGSGNTPTTITTSIDKSQHNPNVVIGSDLSQNAGGRGNISAGGDMAGRDVNKNPITTNTDNSNQGNPITYPPGP